jgi:hypothetical protein
MSIPSYDSVLVTGSQDQDRSCNRFERTLGVIMMIIIIITLENFDIMGDAERRSNLLRKRLQASNSVLSRSPLVQYK